MKPPLLAAGLGLAAAALMATAAQASPGASKSTTLRITAVATSQHIVDAAPKATKTRPFSTGDIVSFTDKLLAGSRPAGTHQGICTAVAPPRFVCSAVSHLAGGDVVVVGVFDITSGKPQALAIVGGTGRYRGARGELDATLVTNSKETFTYTIMT